MTNSDDARGVLPIAGPALASLWGVKGDGTTDDTKAFQAASSYAAAHPGLELIVPTLCRTTATVTVPGGATISGPGGIICDASVTPAMVCGETTDMRRTAIRRGFTVARARGAPAAGTYGLVFMGGAAIVLEDAVLYNHAVPLRFYETMSEPAWTGIVAHVERGFIAGFTEYGVEFAGWAEAAFHGTRFGAVPLFGTAWDYDAKAVVHVTGGASAPTGGGPNTIRFSDCDAIAFSQSDGTQSCWAALWDFSNMSHPLGEAGEFIWQGGQIEEVAHLLTSDASATVIDEFSLLFTSFVGSIRDQQTSDFVWFGGPGVHPATQFVRTQIIGNRLYQWCENPWAAISLAPQQPILDFVVDTLNTDQAAPAGGSPAAPTSIAIAAPDGSFGRIRVTDVPDIQITGPGAINIVVG